MMVARRMYSLHDINEVEKKYSPFFRLLLGSSKTASLGLFWLSHCCHISFSLTARLAAISVITQVKD